MTPTEAQEHADRLTRCFDLPPTVRDRIADAVTYGPGYSRAVAEALHDALRALGARRTDQSRHEAMVLSLIVLDLTNGERVTVADRRVRYQRTATQTLDMIFAHRPTTDN